MYSLLWRERGILYTPHVLYLLKHDNIKKTIKPKKSMYDFFLSRRRKSTLKAISSAKFPHTLIHVTLYYLVKRRRNNCLCFSKDRQVYMHMNNQDRVFADKNDVWMWLGNLLNFSSLCLLALTYHSNSGVVDEKNESCFFWVVKAPVTF